MIVGTAGHVDHGKTTLVQALTGVDTDRLKEEKRRGITIDLGFAYMPGPAGETIGFVDVPGHENLVRTMVAGAAGIDIALLVVAADEGIMPQTREHLEILGLLGVEGLVAITKCDRIAEPRQAAVARELADRLHGSSFGAIPPILVSARTRVGLDTLRDALFAAMQRRQSHQSGGVFRLAVDRAFTLKGTGTVVAGTALSGKVAVDDVVTLLPSRQKARVRSLHVDNRQAQSGRAGERCALALAGLAKEAVGRGAWISGEANPAETSRFDVALRLLASESKALGAWIPVHLHCGASDVPARVTVLSADSLAPGETGFAQIVTNAPLPLRQGDRFVLRDISARRTIGGGKVVDPRAALRKRRSPERLNRLQVLEIDAPRQALAGLLSLAPGIEDLAIFAADRGLAAGDAAELAAAMQLERFGPDAQSFVLTPATGRAIEARMAAALAAYHAAHADLPGMAREQLRQVLPPVLPKPVFAALVEHMAARGRVASRGHWLHLPDHVVQLSAEDRRIAALMMPLIEKERFRPPRVRDVSGAIAFHETQVRRACKALARSGALIEIAPDHFFKRETVVEMAQIARKLTATQDEGRFSAADFRDALDNGRKVSIQILEYFDRHGLTLRKGDQRNVVRSPELLFGGGFGTTDRGA